MDRRSDHFVILHEADRCSRWFTMDARAVQPIFPKKSLPILSALVIETLRKLSYSESQLERTRCNDPVSHNSNADTVVTNVTGSVRVLYRSKSETHQHIRDSD